MMVVVIIKIFIDLVEIHQTILQFNIMEEAQVP
jgi:hypothetical protein